MIVHSGDFKAAYSVEPSPLEVAEALEFRRDVEHRPSGLDLKVSRSDTYLRVVPNETSSWIGRFEAGPGGLDGAYATPSPCVVCIIVKGQGYWIDVTIPQDFEIVDLIPIKHVIPVPSRSLILFADYIRVGAYSAAGYQWVTEDLSWDGITVNSVTHTSLNGQAWDAPDDCYVPFAVDLETGEVTGGSSRGY
jgi:hypothetical protein